MSGGVDSAVTAALLKAAGWNVYGMCLPILQNTNETDLGIYICEKLGIEYTIADLTKPYQAMLAAEYELDDKLLDDTKEARIRRGNIRARIRMITLYNMAARKNGLVASTDNFTELAAGFWTRFGDEGDIAPIRNLYKSWEVPLLAKIMNVPEAIWRATPTDGLGVDDGDEAQFGCTYLEYDIILMAMLFASNKPYYKLRTLPCKDLDERALQVLSIVTNRLKSTWFKRAGTIQLAPMRDRFINLSTLDKKLISSTILDAIY